MGNLPPKTSLHPSLELRKGVIFLAWLIQNDYQRNLITTAEADSLSAQGEYKRAASLYARCSKPFEEVALVFVDQQQTDALRLYLTQKLVNLGRNVPPRVTILT
jgi:hypothetical protein